MARKFETTIFSVFHQTWRVAAEMTLERFPDAAELIPPGRIPEELAVNEDGLRAHFAIFLKTRRALDYFNATGEALNL